MRLRSLEAGGLCKRVCRIGGCVEVGGRAVLPIPLTVPRRSHRQGLRVPGTLAACGRR